MLAFHSEMVNGNERLNISLNGLISLMKGGKSWAGGTKVKKQQKLFDKWIKNRNAHNLTMGQKTA